MIWYVDVEKEIEVYTNRELIISIFKTFCLRIVVLVVTSHSKGTVSQIVYLGPRFYFMKSRKSGCKKLVKGFRFLS